MIKVLVVLLSTIGVLQAESTTYTILNTIGDGIFYFLPFFVALNACKKMDVNPALGMALAAIVLHPSFTGLANSETAVTFAGLPVQVLDYSAPAITEIEGTKQLTMVSNRDLPKSLRDFF